MHQAWVYTHALGVRLYWAYCHAQHGHDMPCLALPCWACHAQLVLGMHLSTLLGVLPSTQGVEHAP